MKKNKQCQVGITNLLTLLLFAFSSVVMANDYLSEMSSKINSTIILSEEESDWTLGKEVSNVECYYKIVSCDGMPTVLLKFNNKNSGNVKITWENSYEETTGVFEDFNGVQELVAQHGETTEVDCSSVVGPTVITHYRIAPHRAVSLTNYSFKNVQVQIL